MKKILSIVTLVTLIISCKKEISTTPETQPIDLFYRLATIDIDSSVVYGEIAATKLQTEVLGSVNDEGEDYCEKHPNSSRCKTLPIKLDYFNVYVQNNVPTIEWRTSTEDNLARYEIQRSTDGLNFKTIKVVTPKGPSTYTFKDK